MIIRQKKDNSVFFSDCKRSQKREEPENWSSSWRFHFFYSEKVDFLSKIPGDPTVGIHRDKKESRSTRRGQRVGSDLKEF